ncbi:siderophore-interacting protein [Rhodococcus triatomae]|uniref:NADPH-dependent ferric siderophore reductase, contains FAD-binding and SIP domains n=1 Tax=Rhodococcus triatomae TaxID=300028 RepID=A0A1G8GZS3_9NOCA|nr:siderophore-interacting protein [Rhodococcus triatomae]QNG20251.1 siderophore-interacting protein [Rhodococcus triatomae]QNG23834.1 siderophore-interacting protein [Rhodococcus triatomae]SDH99844.1 NADPH-dependent ferric siderophore reductase, contains FAD-binding and SIP domains [Rhodococcus triatomae]
MTSGNATHDDEAVADTGGALSGADHARAIGTVEMRVVELRRPARHLLRIVAESLVPLEDPNWLRPNVAVRIHLATVGDGEISRVYTVRSLDLGAWRMEIDVVLHPGTSPMMMWVAALRAGEVFRLTGPRPHFLPPVVPGRRIAMFLDETAIPALYAILRQWPSGSEAVGWVESADPFPVEELREAADSAGVTLHHVRRDPESLPGTTGALVAAARTLTDPAGHTVWAAGERDEMRALRTHFRSEVGLPKDDVAVFGYWKHGMSTSEVDRHRLAHYERTLAAGGRIDDLDDFAIGV